MFENVLIQLTNLPSNKPSTTGLSLYISTKKPKKLFRVIAQLNQETLRDAQYGQSGTESCIMYICFYSRYSFYTIH